MLVFGKFCVRLHELLLKLISCHYSLLTPLENTRKTIGFLMFSRGIERNKWQQN